MSFRILSQDCRVDNNSYATGLNNNDLIIGPSGAGKTRGYVLPNILQCNESIIVADTKNSLRAETEAVLRQNGYQVYSLDLTGAGPSSGYDPLDYIRLDPRTERYNERDIMAHVYATQLLIWETIVGERDEQFAHVSTGGKNPVLDFIKPGHPLRSRIMDKYNSMVTSFQNHSKVPSFMAKSRARLPLLSWNGTAACIPLL